jgi:hypothetical protein
MGHVKAPLRAATEFPAVPCRRSPSSILLLIKLLLLPCGLTTEAIFAGGNLLDGRLFLNTTLNAILVSVAVNQ